MSIDLWRGLRVIWNYSPRGGYGYVFHTPATVVKTDGESVTVDVEKADGTLVRRTVARKNVWVPCPSCQHRVHIGLCNARSGGTAYACLCSRDTDLRQMAAGEHVDPPPSPSDESRSVGVAGDRCEAGNECGRLGCPNCQA